MAARLWPHYCVASESPGHDDQGIDSLVASLLHRGLSPALLWFWGYVLDSTTLDRYVAAFSHRDTCIVFDVRGSGFTGPAICGLTTTSDGIAASLPPLGCGPEAACRNGRSR